MSVFVRVYISSFSTSVIVYSTGLHSRPICKRIVWSQRPSASTCTAHNNIHFKLALIVWKQQQQQQQYQWRPRQQADSWACVSQGWRTNLVWVCVLLWAFVVLISADVGCLRRRADFAVVIWEAVPTWTQASANGPARKSRSCSVRSQSSAHKAKSRAICCCCCLQKACTLPSP